MPTIVRDCPHCGANKIGFTLQSAAPAPACGQGGMITEALTFQCNACHKMILAIISGQRTLPAPRDYPANLLTERGYHCVATYPNKTFDETPPGTPQAAENAFKQAAASLRAGHFDAACSMYRKAMELSLKAFSPDIEAWKIEKRIDKMAAEHRITPEIQAWAHELRLDGNEALHGDAEATAEMAEQMHELCKFLLTYLYTLPAQVAAAKARRADE